MTKMVNTFIKDVKAIALAHSLITAIDLGVFRALAEGDLTRDELQQRCGITSEPVYSAFLDVLIVNGYIVEDAGCLRLTDLGRAPELTSSWIAEMQAFAEALVQLPNALTTDMWPPLSKLWTYKKTEFPKGLSMSQVHQYSLIMDASQRQLSRAIIDTHYFNTRSRVIEFGGGYGRLAIALAREYPRLNITIIDLPALEEEAVYRIEEAGVAGQVKFLAKNFFKDPLLAEDADCVLFVRTLHDWSDSEAQLLLNRTKGCLSGRGDALIIEPMLNVELSTSSAASALMVALMGGRRRSPERYGEVLLKAGYRCSAVQDTGLPSYVMVKGAA